jgi:regulator of sigma E protease
LPLPALDGGRILFVLAEAIRGKPLPPEKEGYIHYLGFLLLIALLIFVTYRDILRIF